MMRRIAAVFLILAGVGLLALGVAVGHADDAPGAAGLGGALCLACQYFAYRLWRRN